VQITKRKRRWIIGISTAVVLTFIGLVVAASVLSKRFEPFIREQALQYMRERFDADVELGALRIQMPKASPLAVLLNRGRGTSARVEADGVSMRYRGVPDMPPLFGSTVKTSAPGNGPSSPGCLARKSHVKPNSLIAAFGVLPANIPLHADASGISPYSRLLPPPGPVQIAALAADETAAKASDANPIFQAVARIV